MKKLSIQWRLTIITTLFIALICGCLTLFIYKSGVYYIDSLQDTVNAQNEDGSKDGSEEIYISIPDENGKILQMIFPFRFTITKQIIEKQV